MKDTLSTPFSAPFGKNGFNTLEMNVYHGKAGYNYFSGTRNEAGHRLSFSPCLSGGNGIKRRVLMSGDKYQDGFYVRLDDAGRSNPHYIKRAIAALDAVKEKLTAAFETHDIETIRAIAADINTAATKKPAKRSTKEPAPLPAPKLLTKKVLDDFAKVGSQAGSSDPIIVAKFFNALGAGTWYATEYDPESQVFYGYVSIFGDHNDEFGSFSLAELQSLRTVERDRFFTSKPVSAVVAN